MQFRIVQKVFLKRLKETKPTATGPLPELLEAAHEEIVSVADDLDKTDVALSSAADKLACGTQLMRCSLRYGTPDQPRVH
jgi:hypothetical protein